MQLAQAKAVFDAQAKVEKLKNEATTASENMSEPGIGLGGEQFKIWQEILENLRKVEIPNAISKIMYINRIPVCGMHGCRAKDSFDDHAGGVVFGGVGGVAGDVVFGGVGGVAGDVVFGGVGGVAGDVVGGVAGDVVGGVRVDVVFDGGG